MRFTLLSSPFLLISSVFLSVFLSGISLVRAEELDSGFPPFPQVNQLADVQPTDWAYQAIQSLAEQYGCLAGYPDSSFRGDRPLTRYEFAMGLNACLDHLNQPMLPSTADLLSRGDLDTIQRLQAEFNSELAALREQIDTLENRTHELAANQFSTTTKLTGQLAIVMNAGGYTGDTLLDPTGTELANTSPNPTLNYRIALDLNTSFTGTDLLKVRLSASSGGANDNAGAVLEPNFGSGLDFSAKPPGTGTLEITRLYYTFRPLSDLAVTIAPNMRITDYVDLNRYANLGFRDFSTEALVNNYILFPINGPSSGAVVAWNPGEGAFTLHALYAAADAANPSDQGLLRGTASLMRLLYPIAGNPATANLGERGLFGASYQGMVEAEYAPSDNFTLRLQYSGGQVFDHRFDVIGVNAEWAISKTIGIMGRYGYGSYDKTRFGNLTPQYWMAAIVMRDLSYEGTLAGLAVGQPFIEGDVGNITQTNFEAFYALPINDSMQITPVLQVITNPSNQASNSTIITGSVRTVFSF